MGYRKQTGNMKTCPCEDPEITYNIIIVKNVHTVYTVVSKFHMKLEPNMKFTDPVYIILTPLTNCDIFPDNNDPNDLSVHISLTITITKI
jgi:hypothetical protein